MRLAFYTYSYTDRLKMSIPECLERIAKTGYSGIDVSGTNGPSDDPKSFDANRRKLTHATCDRLGLRVEAVITHAQLTDTLADSKRQPLDLKGSVDLAADVKADVVTFHMGGYHEGIDRKTEWKKGVEHIRAAADYGASKHIRLAVDGIWPVWLDDAPDALEQMFDDVDSEYFGVNFDPCYLTLMGVSPVKFVKRFHKRIFHAHLKDHQGKYPEWKHLLPGKGEMNYSQVFRALGEVKFPGAAAVECFTDMKFEEACDFCYGAMVKAATDAGVEFARRDR
jgi:sugar phosphate isomerase/epimerase